MHLYLKALHLIFIITWFAGMFYIVRLFIYNREANDRAEPERSILQQQFAIMSRRLWYGITWPSAILTLIFGPVLMFRSNWNLLLSDEAGRWLLVKLFLVLLLYIYHFSLHRLFVQQSKGDFRYSSQQLRLWNEVATVFLVAIVILATVKQSISLAWGLGGLLIFIILLMVSVRMYKSARK